MLISTQVEVVVEVGVELDKRCWRAAGLFWNFGYDVKDSDSPNDVLYWLEAHFPHTVDRS